MSYSVHYGKSEGYCCPYRYRAKDCGCMKGKITASTLEDIVAKEIRLYTEFFLEKEQTRNIECKVQNSICESLIERKNKLVIDNEKLQVCKRRFMKSISKI